MQIESNRFGVVDVDPDEVVDFPDGLPGFHDVRRMVLLGAGNMPGAQFDHDVHSLYWLQSVDHPDLAFLTIVPWSAYPDYDIELDAEQWATADPDQLCVLAIVTVRREDGGVRLTSNLLAPVVIDTARRTGHQVILQDSDWPVHAPLAAASPTPGAAGC